MTANIQGNIFEDDENDNDPLFIGSKETMYSRSFLERMALKKSINYSGCGNLGDIRFNYQWADYKTSLLCKEITINPISIFDQQLFLQKMIINLLTTLRVDLNVVLTNYSNQLLNDEQHDPTRSYPVSQSQVWRNDSRGVWNNMYGLINFIKWLWIQLYEVRFYDNINCDESSLGYYLLIITIQQMCFAVQNNIKGPRRNENSDERSNIVGISDIVTNDLVRTISDDPNTPVEPWMHPGKSQCFVPYFGGYGAEIKKYRNNPADNIYSSLKCGISGSVNYFIFLYLLSTMVSEDKAVELNSKRLMILLTSILAGDGGHNVREIIFGTASTVILLKNLLDDIKIQLQMQLNNQNITFNQAVKILDNVRDFNWIQEGTIIHRLIIKLQNNLGNALANCQNISNIDYGFTELVMLVLKCLAKWESPINEIYNITSHMNILGIDAQDIQNLGYNINDIDFNYLKSQVYDNFFGNQFFVANNGKVESIHLTNSVQLFYAIENNRYLQDKNISFKQAPDTTFTYILNFLYPGIYDTVDAKTKNHLSSCYPNINLQTHIPFA